MDMVTAPPEIATADVDLVRRRVLGGPGDHRVRGQVSIGRSEAVRLRADDAGLDASLAQTVARDAETYLYYLLSLSCTFRTEPAPVIRARLSVALCQDATRDVPDPIVWSMDPLRASTPVKHRRTLRMSPSMKIAAETVGFETTSERGREFTADEHHIIAEGEGESQAEWGFFRTPTNELTGVYHLNMVVRTSTRVVCRADLALAATRREKLLGLVPYRAEIPPNVGSILLAG